VTPSRIKVGDTVIASAAKQSMLSMLSLCRRMDCFVAALLEMTWRLFLLSHLASAISVHGTFRKWPV
jgi:hypothetical protein